MRRLISVLALTLVGAWAPEGRAEDLGVDDLTYLGAFRLPEAFDWGARGMSFRAAGDDGRGSLIVIGFDQRLSEWGEVSIPEPGAGGFGALPRARLISPMVEFDGRLMERSVDAEESRGGDVACLPPGGGRAREVCYWNIEWWYNVGAEDYPSVGCSQPDGSDPRGPWHVGPRDGVSHSARHGAYLFDIPQWYADSALGGRSLMAGMSREAGCCGGSQGPTLFAFAPWGTDSPPAEGELDALALVYYPERYPECAGPNVGDPAECYYPEYRACDTWLGGAFVQSGSRTAVILSGVKAMGANDYGGGGPGACDESQGYHCEPLEAQLIFYSTDDLAEAAAGRRDPWTIVPYAIWRPEAFQDTGCPQVGGAAADHAGGRLFVIEKGYGENNSAVVHVYGTEPPSDQPPPIVPTDGAPPIASGSGVTYRSGCACGVGGPGLSWGGLALAALVGTIALSGRRRRKVSSL